MLFDDRRKNCSQEDDLEIRKNFQTCTYNITNKFTKNINDTGVFKPPCEDKVCEMLNNCSRDCSGILYSCNPVVNRTIIFGSALNSSIHYIKSLSHREDKVITLELCNITLPSSNYIAQETLLHILQGLNEEIERNSTQFTESPLVLSTQESNDSNKGILLDVKLKYLVSIITYLLIN
eukprot:TRINITY_DN32784_c0_g1_i1.p1 TRINITY_DN32784_c0_g1~~TRINITY_DN32784_c0_g1_i1.p1  ORF type:complete len:202 (+),score=5.69 TRINITY_DN32784_c0_g1_i1:74-607(+)